LGCASELTTTCNTLPYTPDPLFGNVSFFQQFSGMRGYFEIRQKALHANSLLIIQQNTPLSSNGVRCLPGCWLCRSQKRPELIPVHTIGSTLRMFRLLSNKTVEKLFFRKPVIPVTARQACFGHSGWQTPGFDRLNPRLNPRLDNRLNHRLDNAQPPGVDRLLFRNINLALPLIDQVPLMFTNPDRKKPARCGWLPPAHQVQMIHKGYHLSHRN